ncbi:hypothetical protein SDC9_179868 [bioreactor metagenome]|uniref:Uncharacterized protein n=1 Tax=bioreactor metagenome TaxID=1076179 RepID=A0A645H116_9ZZZZ
MHLSLELVCFHDGHNRSGLLDLRFRFGLIRVHLLRFLIGLFDARFQHFAVRTHVLSQVEQSAVLGCLLVQDALLHQAADPLIGLACHGTEISGFDIDRHSRLQHKYFSAVNDCLRFLRHVAPAFPWFVRAGPACLDWRAAFLEVSMLALLSILLS